MAPQPRAGVGSRYRIAIALAASVALAFTASHLSAQVVPGKNVNMVAGTDWPGGDPFLQRQNEPSIAVSSRNEQHLLAGANDYRTVDLPGSPLTKPSGDAWLGVFKSLDGGQTWKSTLLPGYPQDTVNANSPLKGYDAGADPAVRAGSNGLFFYSGIAFQRAVPTASNSAVRDGEEPKTAATGNGKIKVKVKNQKPQKVKTKKGKPRQAGSSSIGSGSVRSVAESDNRTAEAAQGTIASGSAVFVSTFMDLNNLETGDPIAYVRTSIVDSDSGARFLDKQWIGVDVPRGNASMCSFQIPQADGDPVVQEFPGGRIYVAYTAFVGPESNNNAQIMVSYSANCGESWSPPRNISMVPDPDVDDDGIATTADVNLVKALVGKRCGNDGFLPAFDINQDCVINLLDLAVISRNLGRSYSTVRRVPQGATIAIHPLTGAVYIAWREFRNGALPDVIQVVRSTDFGVTFSAPLTVSSLAPYDQGTSIGSFRSNAFPTIAADASRVYLAWASRGYATTNASPAGESRIVMSTSTDGTSWSAPYAVDEPNRPGHQLMPALTFGAGKLSLIYYDLREDVSQLFGPFIDELPILNAPSPKPPRHTMDVRLAQADPGPAPVFRSTQLSEYAVGVVPGTSVPQQLTFNPPNLTLFRQGTVPFMGDYIDLITAPSIRANADGTWAFNIEPGSASGGYAVWTDNRNVRAGPGGDLTDYTPPNSPARGAVSLFDPSVVLPQCEPGQTGTRNQDIFGARFDQGLIAGALGNTKTLGPVQRGFALLIQNTTSQTRSYRLTILDQPVGGQASFRQFEAPLTVLDVSIPRLSSVARTAYVSSSDPTARVTINVEEISAPGAPAPLNGGLHSAIVINGDASNPAIENPAIENPAIENKDIQAVEVYNPRINPAIENPAIENPAIDNPAIDNPAIENVTVANQGIINPAIENPAIENPAIENPAIENPAIENVTLANGSISDTTWTLTNDGNTSAVYAVKLLLNQAVPNGILTQLIIHKPYTTPAAAPNCELKVQLHNNILVNITTPAFAVQNPAAPAIENPAIENPAIENPAIDNATVALAPGETAFVTIRAFDPDKTDAITFSPAAAVTPAAVAQSVNTEDITPGQPPPPPPVAVSTTIAVPDLADAIFLSGNYGQQLYASVPGTWAIIAGALPTGVSLSPTGLFSGVPTTPGTFNFTVEFTSTAAPVQRVQRSFTVNIAESLAIVTTALPDAVTSFEYASTVNSVGGVNPKAWTVSSGALPAGLTLDPATGALTGTPTATGTFNFTLQVVDSASTPNTASASFALTVADQASFERIWIGVDSNFSNPANWNPTGVPTATDDVLLNGPEAIAVLSADVTVHNLTLLNGATIDTNGFTLTVTGDLQAGTTITGSGLVRMTGVDATASGTVSNLHVAAGASVTLSAPLHVTGHLTLGGGMLLGGFPLTVDGLLIVPEGLEFTPGILGDGALVTVGGLDVAALVLDNAPIVMTNGTFVRFDNVQFQSFPPQTTRLTISGPGSAAPITLQTPRFLETPTTGFYIKATDTADDDYGLTIHVTNPQAVNGPSHTLEVSGAAVIWATQLADLALTQQDSADPVAVGGTVTYSLVVTNTGPDTAFGAQLIDTLPPLATFVAGASTSSCVWASGVVTCALGDLNPGGSVTVSITVVPSGIGTISNTAQVFSTTPDQNVANNQAVEQTTVTGVVGNSADLSITKTHSPASPVVGANLTYTLTVTNHGPSAAHAVSLVDTLPAGVSFESVARAGCTYVSGTLTCDLATLASGASVAVNIVVTPTTSQVVSNTAVVTSVTVDPVEANNTATDILMVVPFAPCPTQAWSAPAYVPVGALSATGLLTTADFNGDGNIDVAVTASSLPAVTVMFGDGSGGFGTPVELTLPATANSVIAADLNHDARPDLMLAVGSTMVVLLRDAAGDAGAFTPAVGSPYSTGIAGFGLATGLFNGDAHLDIAVSQFTGNTVAVLLGNGNGGFGSATTFPSGTNPINVMVRDFNGDGKADLAVPNQGTSTISILSGDGLGAFAAPVVTTVPGTVNRLRDLGDINSDGFPDLGVTVTSGGLMLLINDQVGGFAAPVTVLSGISIGFVPPAVDLNGDGAVDLVVASSNDGGFHVLYGDGTGAFPTQTRIVVGTGLNNHDVVDLNGDDRPDIVATRPNALPGQIVVVLNNCGTTDTANLTVTQSGPASAAAGEHLTYSVTVTNNGPMTATGVVLIDVPSAGLAFESASVACTDQGNAVSCALPTIISGGSVTVDFELLATGAGARFNIAKATAQQFDSNLDDNIATVPTAVSASPVTFVVTTTADAGTGSLRQAILNSNANPGSTNHIHFNIGEGPTYSIGLLTALPTITAPVVIDGWSEAGSGYAGPPVVELNGQATSSGNGLTISAGGSTIRGLVINRFKGAGLSLQSSGGNVVQGNYIGTNLDGSAAAGNLGAGIVVVNSPNNTIGGTLAAHRNVISGNANIGVAINTASGNIVQGNYIGTDVTGGAIVANGQSGVDVFNTGATGNVIGGTATGAGNLISGNGSNGNFGVGVHLSTNSANTTVQGNKIGTDLSGTLALANANGGVQASSSSNNIIGGTATGAGNLISGNGSAAGQAGNVGEGLGLFGTSTNNVVQGNLIGTDAAGSAALPNTGTGVAVAAPNNTLGGATAAARNVISGNGSDGIYIFSAATGTVVSGNFIGTDITGLLPIPNFSNGVAVEPSASGIGIGTIDAGNTIAFNSAAGVRVADGVSGVAIRGNSFFGNGGLGIDLGSDGVTANDPGDADTGANNLQNFPIITSASHGSTIVAGTLNSTPSTIFTLDFYANSGTCNASTEAGRYLGSGSVTTDSLGNGSFSLSLSANTIAAESITATANDPAGNTSELSACVALTSPSAAVVTIAATDASASEASADPGTFTVTRTGSTASALVVDVSISGTASNGVDYGSLNTSVTIAAGSASAAVIVTPVDDATGEGAETVVITLSDGEVYDVGTPDSATVTIADNDSAAVTATDPTASEVGDPATFTISRGSTEPTTLDRDVVVALAGTATHFTDYNFTGNLVSNQTAQIIVRIPEGASSTVVTLQPLVNAANLSTTEGDETVELTAEGSTASATIVDEPLATVSVSDANAIETGDVGTFVVSRGPGASTAFLRDVVVAVSGTAANFTDYQFTGNVISNQATQVIVRIPAGQESATVTVMPASDAASEGAETVILTAETGPAATVNIADAQAISMALVGTQVVGKDRTAPLLVTLAQPAPVGGLTIAITSDHINILTVAAPGSVTIPEGQSTGQIILTGVDVGVTTLRGNASGFPEATQTVTVTLNVITTPSTLSVPLTQTTALSISIPNPAPAGGVVFDVVSANPAVIEVMTPQVTVPAGALAVNATVRGAAPGTASVTVSRSDYSASTTSVTSAANLNVVEAIASFTAGFTAPTLTVRVESAGSPVAVPSDLVVTLTPVDATCISVPATVTIPSGQVSATFVPAYGGSANLPCTTAVTASASGPTPDTVSITVNSAGPILVQGTQIVGAGLQFGTSATLGASQHGGVAVTVTSNDPSRVLVSLNGTTAGSASVAVNVADGSTYVPFYVQGLENVTGSTTITVSSTGFTSGTMPVNLVPSAVQIANLATSTTSLSADDTNWYVQTGLPNAGNTGLNQIQHVRAGGPPFVVTLSNSNAAVAQLRSDEPAVTGQIVTKPIQPNIYYTQAIATGTTYGLALHTLGGGSTTVTVTGPAGVVSVPANGVTVAVTAPGLTMPSPQSVGAGLQLSTPATLSGAQHGGVAVTVTSSAPGVLRVSPNATTAGTASIVVNVANGATSVPFYVQGMENTTGSAIVSVSAPGFATGTVTMNVVQSAVQIVSLATSTTSLSADDTSWYVQTGLPNTGNTGLNQIQHVRAGGPPFVVTLNNSNAAVAQLRSDEPAATGQIVTKPIQPNIYYSQAIASGTTYGLAFDALGGGSTTVTATGPAGVVSVPANGVTVTVTAPGLTMPTPQSVGAGLQLSTSATLGGSQHGGVAVTVTSSAPGVLRVSPNATTAGSASIVVNVANGATSVPFYVQGMENTTGSAIVSVSAPGFAAGTVTMNVLQAAIQIVNLATSTTSLSADDTTWYVQTGLPNTGNTGLNQIQHVRAGGPPFVVTLNNSNAAVAQLRSDEPAATGQIVTKPIQPNIYYSQAIASGTTYGLAFDALGGGSTTVTATGPAGVLSVPVAGVTVTVTSPGISMPSAQTVGAGLQLFTPATLGGSQHGGVAVTVTSSAPGVLRVSPNNTTAGTASIVVNVANGSTTVPFHVQGMENTSGTAIVSVSAPGFTTGTVAMTVAQAAIEIANLATSADAAAGELTNWYVHVGVPNAGNTSLSIQNVRAGGPAFVVTLSSNNVAVAELRSDEPAATGQVVTKPIKPNFYYPTAITAGTTYGLALRPLSSGTATITATGPAGVTTVSGATRTVTVTGVPTTVSIAATDPDATEAGATTGTFTITRSAVTSQSLSVGYTRSGSATGGSDFTNFSSTNVFIPANQASVSITVTPLADQAVESAETVTLTLANAAGYDLGASTQATVTIADDPTIVSIEAIDPDASEAGTNTGRFRLTRSGGSTAALGVSYTRSGTAVAGTDYSNNFSATFVTIPAGQSFVEIVVTPLVNVATEPAETVILTLSSTAQYTLGATSQATVTIIDGSF